MIRLESFTISAKKDGLEIYAQVDKSFSVKDEKTEIWNCTVEMCDDDGEIYVLDYCGEIPSVMGALEWASSSIASTVNVSPDIRREDQSLFASMAIGDPYPANLNQNIRYGGLL